MCHPADNFRMIFLLALIAVKWKGPLRAQNAHREIHPQSIQPGLS